MPIVANGKSAEVVPLFTSSNGQTSWWNLRLVVELVSGAGAQVAIKVNGNDVPNQNGAFVAGVDPSAYPTRQACMIVQLDDGDAVTADVQGPGTVNLSLSGDVCAEQL